MKALILFILFFIATGCTTSKVKTDSKENAERREVRSHIAKYEI